MKQLLHSLNAPHHLITATLLALALFSFSHSALASCFDENKPDDENYLSCKTGAEQGNADAQYNLGKMHYYGQGVSQDNEQALAWYLKAAEQSNANAQFNLAVMLENKQDEKQAVSWYTKAAEQGHLYAQVNLGSLYSNSHGKLQDYAQAIKWYTKAAEQGDVKAQSNLGLMSVYGLGTAKNYNTAYMWFHIAVKNGSEVGRKGMDLSTQMISPAQIKVAEKSAEEWMAAHK